MRLVSKTPAALIRAQMAMAAALVVFATAGCDMGDITTTTKDQAGQTSPDLVSHAATSDEDPQVTSHNPSEMTATRPDAGSASTGEVVTEARPDAGSATGTGEDPESTDSEGAAPQRPVEAEVPSDVPPEEVDDATVTDLVAPAIVSDAQLLSDPDGLDPDGLATLVADDALTQAQALVQEYQDLGWRQVGTPVVASANLLRLDEEADPPHAEVEICLDHTNVDVVDGDGMSVIDPAAPRRVLNHFELEWQDDAWIVVDRTFPVDTDC